MEGYKTQSTYEKDFITAWFVVTIQRICIAKGSM